MKKQITITYLASIHIFLVLILLKGDFIDGFEHKLDNHIPVQFAESTQYFDRMLSYHKKMDGNVPKRSVIFIGDSITQGLCVSAIASPAVNYGIGSDTTVGVLKRLPYYNSIKNASAVVLAIGINDIKSRSNDEILKNYRDIIAQLPKTITVIVNAVLPVDEEVRDDWKGWNQDRIKTLNSSLEHIAAVEKNVFFIDAGSLLIDKSGNLADMCHVDGVHLNSKGNAIWIDILKTEIQKAQQSAAIGPRRKGVS